MTIQQASRLLHSVKSVEEWNEKREVIKNSVTDQDWLTNYVDWIDCRGLIVKLLGKDKIRLK